MSPPEANTIDPENLLLSPEETREALGPGVFLEASRGTKRAEQLGTMLKAAAVSSAFRSYAGRAQHQDLELPVQIGLMALVLQSESAAKHMFDEVAKASHLRTSLDGTDVAVETVTASNGLVSYWSYLQRQSVLAIATVDTLDPARVSMTEFRSLVGTFSSHLKRSIA
jgi:hypothetical protein